MADSTAAEQPVPEGEPDEEGTAFAQRVKGHIISIAPDTQVGKYEITAELHLYPESWPVNGMDFDRTIRTIRVVGKTTKYNAGRMRIGDAVTFKVMP